MREVETKLDQSLIALRRILRATELYTKRLAVTTNLTNAQFRVLQLVGQTAPTTPKAVADRMGVTKATMTNLINKLQSKGLLHKVKSTSDGRQMEVTLTDEGRETLESSPDPLQQRYVEQFHALSDWEQSQLLASLERVASMLDADEIDAAPVLSAGSLHSG